MDVKLTEFSKRHFEKKFGGTKILDRTPEEFEVVLREEISLENYRVLDGYAEFCKLLVFNNFTKARVGTMRINLNNYQYLRSGYSSRRTGELPVLSRWFDLPLPAPKAKYLIVVVYSKEQLESEAAARGEELMFDANWGVVAILGQSHDEEEPMPPATMLRNALGKEEGGSGIAIDPDKYDEAVEFWKRHAIIK